MPRSKDACGAAIAAAVKALGVAPGTEVSDDQLAGVWKAAMDELFKHDLANATVTVDVTGSVTSGAGAGGAVIGTGTKTGGIA